MKLIKTTFKNILSFGGNIEHTIDYSSGLNQLSGDNGLGKSNIISLINIGIYFNYPNTVTTVVHDLQKSGYIEHTIENDGFVWRINSEFSRSKVKSITVYKNDAVQDWGNPTKAQILILDQIFPMPISVFNNIFCNSIDSISSLLKLTAKDSRDIVNNIFDLNDINLVSKMVTAGTTKAANDLKDSRLVSDGLNQSYTESVASLVELKKDDDSDKEKKILECNKLISENVILSSKSLLRINDYNNKKSDCDKVLTENHLRNTIELNNEVVEEITKKSGLLSTHTSDLSVAQINKVNYDLNTLYAKHEAVKKTHKVYVDKIANHILDHDVKQKSHDDLILEVNGIDIYDTKIYYFRRYMLLTDIVSTSANSIEDSTNEITELTESHITVSNKLSKISADIIVAKSKKAFYDKGECSVCGLDFESPENVILASENNTNLIEMARESLNLSSDVIILNNRISERHSLIINLQSSKTAAENEIKGMVLENIYEFTIDSDFDTLSAASAHKRIVIKDKCDVLLGEINKINETIKTDTVPMLADSKSMQEYALKSTNNFSININTYIPLDVAESIEDIELEISTCELLMSTINSRLDVLNAETKNLVSIIDSRTTDVNIIVPFDINDTISEHSQLLLKIIEEEGIKKVYDDILIEKRHELSLLNKDDDNKFSALEKQISNQKIRLDSSKLITLKAIEEVKVFSILKTIYNDGLLKETLIGKTIGAINNIINTIANDYDIAVNVEYDSSFSPTFRKLGGIIEYNQLSVGQKKMLEIMSIIAIASYYQFVYKDINFLFLDEAVSGLTTANSCKILAAIKQHLVMKHGFSVFVTTQVYLSSTMIDTSINLVDSGTYTDFTTTAID